MTAALATRLDLRPYLRRASEEGVALVPDAVPESSLRPLLGELDALAFSPPPANALPVTTRSDLSILDGLPDGCPALAGLRDELVEAVHRDGAGIGGLPEWQPNHVFVRRYHPGSTGMSPHQDGLRFRYLVATVTVLGSATFLCYNDAGTIVETYDLGPGDLVLLRGAGLGGLPDSRPRHAVGGPGTRLRCSVAFRMNSPSDVLDAHHDTGSVLQPVRSPGRAVADEPGQPGSLSRCDAVGSLHRY
jgi:hypothetical protein